MKEQVTKFLGNIGFGVVIILAVIFFYVRFYKVDNIKQENNIYEYLQDSLETYRKKDSSQVATILNFESDNAKLFIQLQTSNEEVKYLQKLVKENSKRINNGGNVITFKDNTTATIEEPTVVYLTDTIVDSSICKNIVYKSNFNKGNWIIGDVTARYDTTEINLTINNQYDIVVGEERGGLFKKKKSFAEITNHNPYTSITTLKSYRVTTPRKKRMGIGVHVGYGANFTNPPRLGLQIGAGLQYNLIEF